MTEGAAQPPARRLFFACWPDRTTRERMAHACRKAVRGSGGRPVPQENLHVTLVFLGSVAESAVPSAVAAGHAAAAAGQPFELVFDRLAHWPRPQVLVAEATDTPAAATALSGSLVAGLAEAGFAFDRRPFRPHVTLARKMGKPAARLALRPVCWPVGELALVESVTDRSGARYSVRQRWPLAAPGSPPEPPPAAHSPSG